MKILRHRFFAILAVCLTCGLVLSVVSPLVVNAADKDKAEGQRVWLSGLDSHGGPDNIIYTVPFGHQFVLTDIVVTRGLFATAGVLGANVYSNASNAPSAGVPFSVRFFIDADKPDAQAVLNLTTGAVFYGGESILIGTAYNGVPPDPTQLRYDIGGMLFEASNTSCGFEICPGG